MNVLNDLIGYTGLSREQVMQRLRREGVYHYHAEHTFWNPKTTSELTWFYRHSVNYLFGLAWHPYEKIIAKRFQPADGPVVELAPGVGQNGIYLASHGIRYIYAGLSAIETSFTQYRVLKRGIPPSLFSFADPFSQASGWKLDPLAVFANTSEHFGKIGIILAFGTLTRRTLARHTRHAQQPTHVRTV